MRKRKGLRLPGEDNRIPLTGKERAMNPDPESQHNKSLSFKRLSVVVVFVLIVLAGMILPAVMASYERASRTSCMSNLSHMGKACAMYSMDHGGPLPSTFLSLAEYANNPRLFTCRSTKKMWGTLQTVDEWTDYVLVTNVFAVSQSDMVVAYCRPENHKNQGCNVLFVDGSVMWVNPEAFSNLSCDVEMHATLNTRAPQGWRWGCNPCELSYPNLAALANQQDDESIANLVTNGGISSDEPESLDEAVRKNDIATAKKHIAAVGADSADVRWAPLWTAVGDDDGLAMVNCLSRQGLM